MRYPCSYMIYSAAFDGLPGAAKAAVYRRLTSVLSATPAGRDAIQILRDTKPGFP